MDEQKPESNRLRILGTGLLILIIILAAVYALPSVRNAIDTYFAQVEENRKLEALQTFEASQPQGNLTEQEKRELLNQE